VSTEDVSTEDRAFIERSLADLEREHAAGDLSDDDLARLSRRYRRRLDVLDGVSEPVARKHVRPGRRLAWAAGVLAVAVGAGLFVARSAGQRLPGDTLSKGEASGTTQILAQARAALGADRQAAATSYDKVLAIEPDNTEARTYRAWIERLDTKAQVDAGTLTADAARPTYVTIAERLDAAAKLDPTYADPRCFQTVITFRDLAKAEEARKLYEQCVGTNPSQQALGLVSKVGEDIDIALAALPDPVVSKLAKARIARNGTPVTALALYEEVIAADPKNVEARTWKDWITAQSAIQVFTRGKLAEEVLVKTLDSVQSRLAVVRTDAPAAGDPACVDAILRVYRGDTVGANAPLAICRASVADPSLRTAANDIVAAAAADDAGADASTTTATKAP
jgi:tetratricopeptide (TPR) repeat protein